MAKTIVLLSDLHIGSNARTNWYQRDLHEPLLLAIFEHVKAHAATIDELIILGDLVDQWTYPPAETPPSFDDIIAANPAIFGGEVDGEQVPGALREVVAALAAHGGRVTYLPGNHDMALTAEDMARFTDGAGHSIRFEAGRVYEPPAGHGKMVCTHGHMYSMFNAPDPVGDPVHGLPLGHFVTRLCALHAVGELADGQTVADLPVSGDPSGAALLGDARVAVFRAIQLEKGGLSAIVLDTFLAAAGVGRDVEFVMRDGSRITGAAVIEAYAGLRESWKDEKRFPRALFGIEAGALALLVTDATNNLLPFAGTLGGKYRVVVMGHTHVPIDEDSHPLLIGHSVYANPGFNCPSRPDLAREKDPSLVTFTEVVADDAARTFAVSTRFVTGTPGALGVAPKAFGDARVVSMD